MIMKMPAEPSASFLKLTAKKWLIKNSNQKAAHKNVS